jgi:branched-chain amino acid transport system substrate-binding protein
MMKKYQSLFVVLVLAAMVLAACAPAATPTAAVEPTAAEAAPTEAVAAEEPTAAAPAAAGAPDVCATDEFGCAAIPAGGKIKIGMGAPMTGDNAQFGVDISQGAMIAVQDAGEFDGVTFELVAEDDGGSPEGGAAVANKFVADPQIVAIAGHIFSGATAAAIPIYEKAGLPMMSPSATNPDLTTTGSMVFNRGVFTDAAQGKFAAEYLFNTLGVTKLAVMHDGQAYGQGLAEVVAAHFAELGGEVVATEAITPNESDYSAPLASIAAKSPQAVYYGGYVQEGVVLVNQWKQSGLDGVTFFGCDGTFGADFIARTGANGEGAYAVALIPAESDTVTKFDETYQSEFGAAAGSLSPYTWNAYDSAASLIYAIEQVAIKADDGTVYIPRGELVKAVRGLTDFQGLSGILTCNEVGECNASGPVFYVVQDGAWVAATK